MKEDKYIAQQAYQYAMAEGCKACRVMYSYYIGTNIDYRAGEVDTIKQNYTNDLTIRLFVDDRSSIVSTNLLDIEAIKPIIKRGIEVTKMLAKDLCRTLPDSERCYHGAGVDLEIEDFNYFDYTTNQKIDLIKMVVAEIHDKPLIENRCVYRDSYSYEYIIDSNGLEVESAGTSFTICSDISVQGEGDAKPRGFKGWSKLTFPELRQVIPGTATEAWQMANDQIGERRTVKGTYSVLVDKRCIDTLLQPIIDAASGGALQQNNSFLLGKMGKSIGSSLFTLADKPLTKHSFGSRFYDGEGIMSSDHEFITNGVLKMYYISTYYANKMGCKPTEMDPAKLIMPEGERSVTEILSTMQEGIYITDFIGGNCNASTGDFSYGVNGFLIQNGEKVAPLDGINLSGNMLDIFHHLIELANDSDKDSSLQVPSMVFHNIHFADETEQ